MFYANSISTNHLSPLIASISSWLLSRLTIYLFVRFQSLSLTKKNSYNWWRRELSCHDVVIDDIIGVYPMYEHSHVLCISKKSLYHSDPLVAIKFIVINSISVIHIITLYIPCNTYRRTCSSDVYHRIRSSAICLKNGLTWWTTMMCDVWCNILNEASEDLFLEDSVKKKITVVGYGFCCEK